MRTYVAFTGTLFGLLTIVHIWRVISESPRVLDPFFVGVTVIAAALGLWAWRLLRATKPAA